ncbi:flagellar assembly protein FliH [Rhodoferax sp. GW822-FHT02A01]|uniref:FliH/SctL family protein n=1 Tax=Rhodoferax sp. GW822-FHT02A01 TaxID=3141537 RepID=UPI00315CCC09
MSRAHSTFIPAEKVAEASNWNFDPVDQASLRFAAKVKAQAEAQDRARDELARQSGYAEGYAQGHAQATLEGQRLINEYIANEGQQAAQHFASLFRSAQEQIEQSQQTLAKGVLELACELARQVLRRELTVNPNALQPVVREALGMLTVDTKMAAVRMNPVDLDVFAEDLQSEFSNLQLTLVPDVNVLAGGCLVEAAGTVIDGTVQRRWNKAVASLGLDSSWEQEDDAP